MALHYSHPNTPPTQAQYEDMISVYPIFSELGHIFPLCHGKALPLLNLQIILANKDIAFIKSLNQKTILVKREVFSWLSDRKILSDM